MSEKQASVSVRPQSWKKEDVPYYEGDVSVTSSNKIVRMPVGQIRLLERARPGRAFMDFLGIRRGTLASIDFERTEILDAMCVKWISERGIIDLDQMSIEALHYMGEFRRLLNAK